MSPRRPRAVPVGTLLLVLLLLGVVACGPPDESSGPSGQRDSDAAAGQSEDDGDDAYVPPPAALPEATDVPELRQYVALGDSYTAGPNIPPVDNASEGCFRSSANYPSLVAGAVEPAQFVDRSCGGATTQNMTSEQRTITGQVPPQFSALTEGTDLVTIGLGGNDFNLFGTLIGYCPTLRREDPQGAPCRKALRTSEGEDGLAMRLPELTDRLVGVVEGVRERSPDARILLVGYPEIIPERGTCPDLLPLARRDYRYADKIADGLNEAVADAAEAADVTLIDVAEVSAGHDICGDEPWVNGQVPATDAQLYHPFPVHQETVARMIVEELST
ncbi:SGNH/GDSL hydrolase family protein [Nocardioides donggukensis]|uniref:SGNH/GDSL hydrolase family protein n=1 Tax=Nocardioides donggukensis TaxID=2774019 RepID=A0A927KB90_9ACTN|nr:SGNH/GDSL hydrolase family protein [Nocardioides donggukensis]MBD8871121.1 SGNH/GDSL hydrolase family protein [Nocardioides donggukensis]